MHFRRYSSEFDVNGTEVFSKNLIFVQQLKSDGTYAAFTNTILSFDDRGLYQRLVTIAVGVGVGSPAYNSLGCLPQWVNMGKINETLVPKSVNTNNSGFTLIEFLVAIVILMVGMLGLLQTVNYAISNNMTNQLRQEALMVGDEQINLEKAKKFEAISTNTRSAVVPRMVNGAFRNYSVIKTSTALTSQSTNIDMQLIWKYKGQRYVHSISSVVSQYQ